MSKLSLITAISDYMSRKTQQLTAADSIIDVKQKS